MLDYEEGYNALKTAKDRTLGDVIKAPDLGDVIKAMDGIRKLLVALLVTIVLMFGWIFATKQGMHSCVDEAGYSITVGESTACIAQH